MIFVVHLCNKKLHTTSPVDTVPQSLRTSERNDASLSQLHGFFGSRVAAHPRLFMLDAEFTETGNQDIVTGFKRSLDYLDQSFSDLGGPLFVIAVRIGDGVNDISFGEGHGVILLADIETPESYADLIPRKRAI